MTASSELKRRAREVLQGKYFVSATMTASLMLFTSLMTLLLNLSGFGTSQELFHQICFWFLWGIMILLGALVEVGLIKFLYHCSKTNDVRQPGALFYGFRNQSDTFLLTLAFRYAIVIVWFVPAYLMFEHIPFLSLDWTQIVPALFPVLLAALAAMLPAVLAALPFCFTNYVLLDSPYASPLEALMGSWQLTKGKRGTILRTWISFLPICLAGLGTYGLGFIWIRPYYHTTMNQMYLEVTGQQVVSTPAKGQATPMQE